MEQLGVAVVVVDEVTSGLFEITVANQAIA
jgi:hypothetical protein